MAATKKKKKKKKAAAAKKKAPAKKAPAKKTKKKKAVKAKAKPKPQDVLPTAEEEERFWSLLEDAWATQSKEVNAARKALSKRKPSSDDDEDDVEGLDVVDDALEGVMESLTEVFAFEEFPKEELIAMDRVLERKLYDIDRQEIQEVTDGSDDGFLYARGYIVALGKDFYDAVNKNPKMAIMDAECEEMCYLPAHVYSERFGGEFPETGAKISRESCSNEKAWPDLG